MIKQLGNISGLYARLVSCPGLVPIPFSRSARKNLGISEFPDALDLDPSPSKRCNTRRLPLAFGSRQ
jgi:hypothetical protein